MDHNLEKKPIFHTLKNVADKGELQDNRFHEDVEISKVLHDRMVLRPSFQTMQKSAQGLYQLATIL